MAGKSKINFAEIGQRIGGIAAGVTAAGVVRRYLTNSVKMKETTVDAILIGVGVFGPSLAGKNPMLQHAGDAIIAKGVDAILRDKMGNFVAGVEDGVYGTHDEYDGVGYYPTSDETIVSGIEDGVAGTGSGVGSTL